MKSQIPPGRALWAVCWIAVAALPVRTAGAADWTAKRYLDPFTGESRCVAESRAQSFHDGYQKSKMRLRLDRKALVVVTDSNIDSGSTENGLLVEGRDFVKMESIQRDQNAVFEREIARITRDFQQGLRVSVSLKFWPTWPPKGVKTVEFGLIGFRDAFAKLPGC